MEDTIIENISQEPSKWKKIIDFVVKILGSVVGLSFIRFISFLLCTHLGVNNFWKLLVVTSGVTILFMILVHFIIKLPPTSKLKKGIKCVRKILLYIIAFILGRFLFVILVRHIFRDTTYIYFIIFGTILYALLFLFVLLLSKRCKLKNRKIIKWIILNVVIILVLILGWLTKAGIIPNWFDIEFLCPERFGVSICKVEKYDKCMEKCGSYNINLSGFSIEGYNNRYYNKSEAGKRRYAPLYYYEDEYYSLIKKEYYQEWVDEMFYEQKNKVSEIELQIGEIHSCKQSCGHNPRRNMDVIAMKPIIYLYPIQETEVNVTLGTPENLSHTYPKYNSERGRNVLAQPDGDLEDIDTGRKLYALYREGKTYAENNFEEGFVVKGEDTISFLEEKLALLGLNEREAEEFIVYWLPQMENNKYNLIRFETKEEQDENMPLNITPTPDTVIRIMMDWKAIDEPIEIPEQELTTPERRGFTVVEWGGSPRN